MNGINQFNPEFIDSLYRLESAQLTFTGYSKINAKTDKLEEYYINDTSFNPLPVYIRYNDNSVTFRYALLSFLDTKENTYSYFLEGHDKEWNFGGNNAYINYPSLPTGKYTLRIKAKDLRGSPSRNELAIPINVLGPWWKSTWAISLMILVVAASIIGYIKWRTYTLKNQKKALEQTVEERTIEIQNQKQLIQSSLAEKETLLREIHHRVKNNLQIISSLLNIQSEHIQDENVLSSIQEGQSRVQAMSLIHQNLYQSEHLNNVDIQNYVQQLVAYLSEMFAGQSKDIKVTVDAPNINFDIDTAIPLGLIINELVSNAYKYAFEKHVAGHINISIKAKTGSDYELEIRDDGKGMPDDASPDKSSSLGLKLVKILSRQLRGTFSFKSDKGAVFLVQFKDLRAYHSSQS